MTIFFTSDNHFGHLNVINYCNRPFSSVWEMDEIMIYRWNTTVKEYDTVYHLGDFTLGNRVKALEILNRLNGNINIIEGNHDFRWFKHFNFNEAGIEVLNSIYELKGYSPIPIVLCHYPMASWPMSHYGSLHLHGHTHGKIGIIGKSSDTDLPPNQDNGTRIDVGVDSWDYYPVSLEELLEGK